MPAESSAIASPVDKEDRRSRILFLIVVTVVLLLGAYLRINRFLLNRSLWIDEAMFALNIIERSPLQLVGPLSYSQKSPVGFTLLVKLLTMAFGVREPVLRVIPLLAGLASLPLFYVLAHMWLPKWASLLAIVLFAVSDSLADYSAQFEKYSSDAMLTIGILLVALWFSDSRRPGRYVVFGVVGAVAVWFSYPIAIVLAGIGLSIFLLAIRRKSYHEALLVAVMAGFWLASAAATWAVSVRPVLEDPSRGGYWARFGGFLELPPRSVAQVESDIATLVQPFEAPLGFALYSGVVLLFGLGAIDAVRRGGTRLFLVTPVLVTVVLSALRLYPIYGRLILFLVPLLLLTLAKGIARILELLPSRTERIVGLGFLALILFQPVRLGLARGLHPREYEETRPLIIQWSESYQEGDVLAVYYGAQPAYRYYTYLFGINKVVPVSINDHRDDPALYCGDVKPLRGSPRVWVLFSHTYPGRHGSEKKIILDCLDSYGQQQKKLKATGASLYLYDLQHGSSDSEAGN